MLGCFLPFYSLTHTHTRVGKKFFSPSNDVHPSIYLSEKTALAGVEFVNHFSKVVFWSHWNRNHPPFFLLSPWSFSCSFTGAREFVARICWSHVSMFFSRSCAAFCLQCTTPSSFPGQSLLTFRYQTLTSSKCIDAHSSVTIILIHEFFLASVIMKNKTKI